MDCQAMTDLGRNLLPAPQRRKVSLAPQRPNNATANFMTSASYFIQAGDVFLRFDLLLITQKKGHF
jgi:hypothetical protein